MTSVYESRQWFNVWIGLFCYLIAETEEEFIQKSGFPALAVLHWNEILVKQGQSRATVHALNCEPVCSFHKSVRRVGTFLRLDDPKLHRPEDFVRRLERLNVPVWYPWLAGYDKHPFFSRLGPASSQIQDLLLSFIPTPLCPDSIPVTPFHDSEASPPPTTSPQAVLDFFAKREREHKRREGVETAAERMSRLHRTKNPPTSGARVWLWEELPGGEWDRETVGHKYRVMVLDEMKPYQKRYDPFYNEWNCCDSLQPPPDYEAESSDEDDETSDHGYPSSQSEHSPAIGVIEQQGEAIWGEDGRSQDVAIFFLPDQGQNTVHPSAEQVAFVIPIEDIDDLAAIQNGSSMALTTEVDTAEEYILRILRLYYGFTPPLPLPQPALPHLPDNVQNRFLKFLGIPLHRVHRDLFHRASIQCAVSFMERLGSGRAQRQEESDLLPHHRESLSFNARLTSMQTITDATTGVSWYMFDFADMSSVPWKLAVQSAMHALMICRLPGEMEDQDIALYLVHHGVPFKTLQQRNSLPQMAQMSTTLISSNLVPQRMKGHIFNEDDYTAYLISTENALRNRRLGRAALKAGGHPWRLAVVMLGFDAVLEGPTCLSAAPEQIFTVRDKVTGEEYVDDGISELESELLCGLFECFTGNGAQTSRKSYHPLPTTLKGSGMDYGRWTVWLENAFKTVREGSSNGSRQPKTMSQWRDAIRGAGEFRRTQSRIEELSKAFITKYMSDRKDT
ncbi:hypothetical protein CVT24_006208 [Panaeolus cyanescens]|uniref:Uncharacterized protein n=1 Tax=Panaeolus cyanescens TaxID=181874 RepID=A0A409WYF2_9AGAR|nr:hypothetical protein CVT24_006208 [Panaeolus cyanescens]